MAGLLSLPSTVIEFWQKDSDPFINSLFGTETPWTFLTIVSGILYLIKKTEREMKNQKEIAWVKPTLLVLYGLNFGISGAGMLFALAATDNGKDCFRCLDRNQLNMITIAMRYLGYAYLCTLLFEFWMKTLEAKQGKVQSTAKLFREITWLLTTFVALKFVPVGYYAMCPVIHCILRTLDYGVKVLQSASPELNFISPSWADKMRNIEVFCWSVLAAQQYWVFYNLQCDRSWANFMGASAAGIQAILTLLD